MNPWIKFVGACATALASATSTAEPQGLTVGNVVSSAAFPCTPERKQQAFKTEAGDIRFTSLTCTQGDSAYVLGVTEYPAAITQSLSVDEMLDSTLDDARSKRHVKIKASQRTTHLNLPALRHHLLDQRQPATETIGLAVVANKRLVFVLATTPPAAATSQATKDFVNSLKIDRR